ncbi:competence/damage-inducible protein A [Rhodococcus sp. DMU1]|uniref:competence/damage-inducible protein A n=1 Tax=Rhodococcus sp. DMU1 TaxID=2722825 RepID=UPI00143E4998|nr:competence/damage-inducible protein A [Rhodococcus sp. DMU1]QIX53598.1 competence/damage-inducible protein A [Rhodococcus sp. DMU1]
MSVRAGIIVTGTEVLTGRIADQNGPWLSHQLLTLGVDVAHLTLCGDRPADLTAQLRFLADQGVDLIITSGGLGPTADDLTVPTIAQFCHRELLLDPELEEHIAGVIRHHRPHTPDLDAGPTRTGIRKQAQIPTGATALPPTGTAPGVVIPAVAGDRPVPTIVILPGPPAELQAMWPNAITAPAVTDVLTRADDLQQETVRAYGLHEAHLAETLRRADAEIADLDRLEITTCLRHGELDMVTRFASADTDIYRRLLDVLTEHHRHQIFSTDGTTIDDQLIELLDGRSIATAESCTGGLIAARLTARPGSSAYVTGGVVAYSNDAKSDLIDVPAETIAAHGAVSEQVAAAMAEGARHRLEADIAVSTTGIAGPTGGTEIKPVGTVCFGVAIDGQPTHTLTRHFPGNREQIRTLTTTAALHLVAAQLKQQ